MVLKNVTYIKVLCNCDLLLPSSVSRIQVGCWYHAVCITHNAPALRQFQNLLALDHCTPGWTVDPWLKSCFVFNFKFSLFNFPSLNTKDKVYLLNMAAEEWVKEDFLSLKRTFFTKIFHSLKVMSDVFWCFSGPETHFPWCSTIGEAQFELVTQ